jgi:hypothetical protein
MDRGIICILVFAACIVIIGAMRTNNSVNEHFAIITPTIESATQDLLINPMVPMTKNEITVAKKLAVGSMMKMSSSDASGIFNIGGDTAFAMKRGGYLGVGTVDPKDGLDITSDTGKNLSISLNDSLRKYRWSLRMRDDAPDINTNPDGALMISSDLNVDPSGVMYMKRTGQVGLGTSTPAAKLHVETTDSDNNGLIISNVKHAQSATLSTSQDGSRLISSGNLDLSANGGDASVYITHDANNKTALGIGIPMPSESLHATGNARIEGGSIFLGGGAGMNIKRGAFVSRNTIGTTLEQPGNGSLIFNTNDKDRLVVDGNGMIKLNNNTTIDGELTAKGITLGDLTISNSKGKLQVCANGQPSSCRNI